MKMKVLTVATLTAALVSVAGVAMAGSYNYSKGSSYAQVESRAGFYPVRSYYKYPSYKPYATTRQSSYNRSVMWGDTSGGAGSTSSTSGNALAVEVEARNYRSGRSISVEAAWASGSTSGSSCAGSGCNGN